MNISPNYFLQSSIKQVNFWFESSTINKDVAVVVNHLNQSVWQLIVPVTFLFCINTLYLPLSVI